VNGARRVRARFPNSGYLHVAGISPDPLDTTWMDGQTKFKYDRKDVPTWSDISGGELVVMTKWVESRLPLVNQDVDSSLFSFGKRSVFKLEVGDPYYLENIYGALDTPGEWYLDPSTRVLTYLPLPGERSESVEAILPVMERLVVIRGKPEAERFVEHLVFRGLTFSHTEWYFPPGFQSYPQHPDAGGFPQAATGVPAAIEAEGARGCHFEGCVITNLGTYAIALGKGCVDNRIDRCVMNDLGGGGVKIGETVLRDSHSLRTGDNVVANCEISNGGRFFHSAIGIWIGHSDGNTLLHNMIHDFYYSGISIGWTWGYGPARAGRNRVELNHVHHIGVLSSGDGPILSDMGGIYTLGTQRGTLIRQNIFHDIAARMYGGWGIYLDEGSSYIVAEKNIVYRTTHGGFHQHYGKNNIVRNNVLAFGRDAQLRRTRVEPHTSYAFERNIVLWSRGMLFDGQPLGGDAVYDRNIYWSSVGQPVQFGPKDFSAWQASGMDHRSVVADPLFRDPERGDFSLASGSPALSLGFEPIPVRSILENTPVHDLPALLPHGPRRLLYNNDGSNIPMAYDTLTPQRAYMRIDPFAGIGVTTFLHNPNPGQNMGYPSKIAPMFHWDTSDNALRGWPLLGKRMSDNFARLVRDSIDPVGLVLDRVRLRGMESFITFRMNELHDVDKPESPLLGPFWKQHPQWRVGGYAGWGKEALNYAVPEVRDYYFALLKEVVERYDLDGLELDFMRFPYYFPYKADSMRACAAIMTDFVERVRKMTLKAGHDRKKEILLAARVPSSLQSCEYVGLDPALWCSKGLVDFLTVAPFLSTEIDIPVDKIKAACGPVPVYAGLEYTIGDRMMTREEMRAAAALLYASGADGIYLFNYFTRWDVGLEPDVQLLSELVSPDSLAGKEKLYTLAVPRYPIPGVSLLGQLPLEMKGGERKTVALRIVEPKQPFSAVLRIECREEISPGDLRVTFNGHSLAEGTNPLNAQVFPQKVPYPLTSTHRILEFRLDPKHLLTANTFSIEAKRSLTVQWLHLATRPLE
jgi:parallel beta-helix repeat protein